MRFVSVIRNGALALCLTAGASGAVELPPLEDNPRIQHEFLSAAVGDAIRKNCPTISTRLFRVWSRFTQLKNYAITLGYTSDDFNQMRQSPEARARLKTMRDAYLRKHGVKEHDNDSYCRLGHEEIEKNSLTGWILRAN